MSGLNYTTFWERLVQWYQGSPFDRFFTFLGEQVFGVTFAEYSHIPLPANAGTTARNIILAFLLAFWIAAVAAVAVKSVLGGFVRRLLSLGATDADHAVTLAEAGYAHRGAIRRDLSRGGVLAKLLCRVGDDEKTVAGTLLPIPETDPQTGEVRPSLLERLSAPDRPVPVESTEEPAPPMPETDFSVPAPEATADAPDAAEPLPEPPASLNLDSDRFYIPEALQARANLRFATSGSGVLSALLSIVISTAVAFLLCRFLPLLFYFGNFILGG